MAQVKLNWFVEGEPIECRYYKSETPIDIDNLPPHIVVEGTTYTDETLEVGKTYYAMISAVRESGEYFSEPMVMTIDGTPTNPDV